MRRCVSPVTNGVSTILETLGVLAEWLQHLTRGRLPLITAALTEVLGEAHERNTSTVRAFSFGQVALQDTPAVRLMRDTGMSLLCQMLQHQSLEAQLAAVGVAQGHGRAPMGFPLKRPLPLEDKILQERKYLAAQLGEQMIVTDSWRLRSAIEDLLLHWWASCSRGAVQAKKYLVRLERPAEYLAMRYFISPDNVVEDFPSFSKHAPRTKRWKWYIDETMRRQTARKPEDFQAIAKSLAEKHVSPSEIVEYLLELEQLIGAANPWAHPPIISQWFTLSPKAFKNIRSTRRLWLKVPGRFKIEIDFALASVHRGHLQTVAQDVLRNPRKVPIQRVDAFLRMVRTWKRKAEREEWLNQLVDKGNEHVRSCVARNIFFISEEARDGKTVVRVLTRILERQRRIDRLADSVAMTLHRSKAWMAKVPKGAVDRLRSLLLSKLRTVERFDHRADDLLGFACPSVAEACALLEHRIREHDRRWRRGSSAERYTAVPYHGLKSLRDLLGDFASFQYFMDWAVRGRWEQYLSGRNDIEHVVRPLFEAPGVTTQFIGHMRKYLREKVKADELDEALAACVYLPFRTENIDLLLTVARPAQESGRTAEIRSMLSSHLLPPEGMSSAVGQPPPELVRRKAVFLEMARRAGPGLVSSILKGQAEWLDADIKGWEKQHEDILNPRA